MKAMILAAGLGTRLRPWTLEHPKALVPVGGVPMLERVISRLKEQGFDDITVNVHHFPEQIKEFIRARDFGVRITISDESDQLLDTGGGLVKASRVFGDEAVLIHNVDILSNADLGNLMRRHLASGASGTLLVSDRDSSRKLIFNDEMELKGWHHLEKGLYRPVGFEAEESDREYAFSGIYVASGAMRDEMLRMFGKRAFPVMDYFLSPERRESVIGLSADHLKLIDIGKPATLEAAQSLF